MKNPSDHLEEDEDAFCHWLGEFEISDVKKLLTALEANDGPFELESRDEIQKAGSKGSAGRWSRVAVWIRPENQEQAERIQQEALKLTI